MADITSIAKQFVQYYYHVFSKDRTLLEPLYRDLSMLSWEDQPFQGAANISEKLTSLPFQKVEHKITTQDAQPASPTGNIIVLVTGLLLVDDGNNPLQFSQTFQLVPDGSSYYVLNDIFRLNYG